MHSILLKLDPLEVFEKLPIGIFILKLENKETKEFRNIFVNQTNCDIVGIDLKPFMHKTLRECFPDSYTHGLPDKYIEALETQKTVKIGEVEYGDNKIKKQVFFLEVVPIDDKHIMLTTENISKLKATQIELQNKQEQLQNKLKEAEHLTRIVSHDLKSPLNVVTNFIDVINNSKENKLDEVSLKGIEFMTESTKRMQQLINDILESSLEGANPKIQEIDTNKIIAEIQDDLQLEITASNASFEIDNLPNIVGYQTEFRLLVQNLVSNAIKYGKPGISPVITIACKSNEDHWLFKICDNGIGIHVKDKNKLFEEFNRGQNQKDKRGFGIGLANCHKIVNMHQGKIWFESTLNEGSIFFFTIPKSIIINK